MIEFRPVTKENLRRLRPGILRLIRGHNDRHITRKAVRHLRELAPSKLVEAGNVCLTAWSGERLVGVILCEEFGKRTSMAVVHRDFRSQGIGRELLKRAVAQMGRFYGEIAADNLPSLRHAFAAGMVAYDAFVRRGKITLRVRNGWQPN